VIGAGRLIAPCHLPTQRLGRLIGNPCLWQEPAGVKLGKNTGVDCVGLDLGMGNDAHLLRISDDDLLTCGEITARRMQKGPCRDYISTSLSAASSTGAVKGFLKTRLMPNSAAPRSIAGSTTAAIMIVGRSMPRFCSSNTNSSPFRPGM
jgi:hypothetical protein